MSRVFWLFFALGGVSLMAGESCTEKRVPPFASPQEVWDAYRQARHEGRWNESFRCATPQAQERSILGIIFCAAYLQKTVDKNTAAKLKAILKDHGVDLEQIEAMAENGRKVDIDKLIGRVKEKERLFDEAMIVISRAVRSPKGKNKERGIALGELKSIKITGDRARGKCMKRLDDRELFAIGGVRQTEIEIKVEFHKIGGRWFVHEGE